MHLCGNITEKGPTPHGVGPFVQGHKGLGMFCFSKHQSCNQCSHWLQQHATGMMHFIVQVLIAT